MPSPVNLNSEQLFTKIGELQMECIFRAKREDELLAQIEELKAKAKPEPKEKNGA